MIPRFLTTSIGKKWIVGITGAILLGFVIGHMVGNLQVFFGPDAINNYATLLHISPELLWVIRLGLLTALLLHVFVTISLVRANRAARPVTYECKNAVQARTATRTMMYSGLLVLCFVIFHLLHYTARVTDERFHHLPRGEHDVHSMLIYGFQNIGVSAFYILSVGLLCLHLSHGIASAMQTLGFNNKYLAHRWVTLANVVSSVIFLGYASIPVAVLTGILRIVQ